MALSNPPPLLATPQDIIAHVSRSFARSLADAPFHPLRHSSSDASAAADDIQAALASMGLGGSLDTTLLLAHNQTRAIQYVSLVVATVSTLMCMVSLYWFLVMRRNFRRTLIMLLIIADLFKSLWFIVFPAVSIGLGTVKSGSTFCDVSGAFLQLAVESCDAAIFFMSLHMSLQVFNSTSPRFGPDGLYRYRYAVFVTWITVPTFMACLAFVRQTSGAYLSQGAYCTLPIRPFWYRLALMWIPRYLMLLYITVTAIRIYCHVGSGFTVFAREVDGSSNHNTETSEPADADRQNTPLRTRRAASRVSSDMQLPELQPNPIESRRPSVLPWDHDLEDPSLAKNGSSMTKPSRDSLMTDTKSRQLSIPLSTRTRQDSQFGPEAVKAVDFGAAEFSQNPADTGDASLRIVATADVAAKSRRRRIQRQTRLLFIYPCVYGILMILPFIQHCFNYSDYYAQHPIFSIALLGSLSSCLMGAADCTVFCWRERPWTNIPGADGTLLGSFRIWSFSGGAGRRLIPRRARKPAPLVCGAASSQPPLASPYDVDKAPTPLSPHATLVRPKVSRPPMHERLFSGQGDRHALAAERAAERLALEREDAQRERAGPLDRKVSDAETAGKKEWYDRFVEDDEEDEDEDEEDERR